MSKAKKKELKFTSPWYRQIDEGTVNIEKSSKLNKSNCRGDEANVISLSNPV